MWQVHDDSIRLIWHIYDASNAADVQGGMTNAPGSEQTAAQAVAEWIASPP